jgi:hypothetical protein
MAPKATELATINAGALACAFGGSEAVDVPVESLSWPEIKMPKDSGKFEMPDGETKAALTGYIVFAVGTRAYFPKPFGQGETSMPDCANTNIRRNAAPDFGDERQADLCAKCSRRTWRKEVDPKTQQAKNVQDCRSSTLILFLEDGQSVPYLLRVRSTSCGKKSSLAKFFTNCGLAGFALAKKYQTVHVELSLEKTKIGGFDTNLLIVEKKGVVEAQETLNLLITLYDRLKEEFEVTFTQEENGDDPIPDGGDDIPV